MYATGGALSPALTAHCTLFLSHSLGVFSFITSTLYNVCDAVDVTIFLDGHEWHELANVSVLSFGTVGGCSGHAGQLTLSRPQALCLVVFLMGNANEKLDDALRCACALRGVGVPCVSHALERHPLCAGLDLSGTLCRARGCGILTLCAAQGSLLDGLVHVHSVGRGCILRGSVREVFSQCVRHRCWCARFLTPSARLECQHSPPPHCSVGHWAGVSLGRGRLFRTEVLLLCASSLPWCPPLTFRALRSQDDAHDAFRWKHGIAQALFGVALFHLWNAKVERRPVVEGALPLFTEIHYKE